jgi:hypothetical protein
MKFDVWQRQDFCPLAKLHALLRKDRELLAYEADNLTSSCAFSLRSRELFTIVCRRGLQFSYAISLVICRLSAVSTL